MEFSEILRRRTLAFALAVVRFCRTLPHGLEADVFRRQLLKSGTSVGANYRSSCRGRSTKERIAKLGVALEEADETDYWLAILTQIEIGNADQRQRLIAECGELIRMFSASLATHRSSPHCDNASKGGRPSGS